MTFPAASKAALWALLSVPGVLILARWATDPELWPGDLLHASGEWSARLIIFALMLTPLSMLFPQWKWVRWLLRHRRAFGVAAFLYALLHLLLYVLDMETPAAMLAEIGALGIWTGWLALLCLLPLGLTSNDAAMRRLRSGWKKLQRLAYPAALLTLVHWMFVHDGLVPALVNFAPLIALQFLRLVRHLRGRSAASHRPRPI
jgi:sulfoxide reductase heme-binding subunit YedZ